MAGQIDTSSGKGQIVDGNRVIGFQFDSTSTNIEAISFVRTSRQDNRWGDLYIKFRSAPRNPHLAVYKYRMPLYRFEQFLLCEHFTKDLIIQMCGRGIPIGYMPLPFTEN